MSVTVYGIRNCDTIKKTRRWLDDNGISYEFHDYKKSGIDEATLKQWATKIDWGKLINRRGTTWRKLDDADQKDITLSKAIKLMQKNTSLIKRPVIQHGDNVLVGFDEAEFAEQFDS